MPKLERAAIEAFEAPLYDPQGKWEAFLFMLETPENPSLIPPIQSNKIKQTYEFMSTGVRQKFSLLDLREDLFEWAIENAKASDICKDVKTSIDAGGGLAVANVPDALVAKLLRLWLVNMKVEFLQKERENAAANEEERKAVSAGKKAEARGKSADKKKGAGKGAGGKFEEALVVPTSAGKRPEKEVTKGQQKLRDRGPGRGDGKNNTIEDEPAWGPEMYLCLRGFGQSPGLLQAIVEDQGIPIGIIYRLELLDITRLDPGTIHAGPPHPVFQVTKAHAEKANENSAWVNTVWASINGIDANDYKELFDRIAKGTYAILEKRRRYRDFYASETVVSVPVMEWGVKEEVKAWSSNPTFKFPKFLLDSIPKESLSVELVLSLLVDQALKCDPTLEGGLKPEQQVQEMQMLNRFFDNSFKHLALDSERSTRSRLVTPDTAASSAGKSRPLTAMSSTSKSGPQPTVRSILQIGNEYEKDLAKLDKFSAFLEVPLSGIHAGNPFSRIIQRFINATQDPDYAQLKREWLLQLTNVQKATSVPEKSIEYALRIQAFHTLLAEEFNQADSASDDAAFLALQDWCWYTTYDATTFPQALQEANIQHAKVLKSFTKQGELLLAFKGNAPVDAESYNEVEDLKYKCKIGFGRYHALSEDQLARMDALFQSSSNPSYMAGNRFLDVQNTKATHFYPDDITTTTISNAQVCRSPRDSRVEVKIGNLHTLTWDNRVLTIVTERQGEASHSLSYEPSVSSGTYKAQLSTASQHLRFLNGKGDLLLMNHPAPEATHVAKSAESHRFVMSSGAVSKFATNGQSEILLPNGSIAKLIDGAWNVIDVNGLEHTAISTNPIPRPQVAPSVHIPSRTLISEREDFLTILKTSHEDGSDVTSLHFNDDTVITHKKGCQGEGDLIHMHHPSYPAVETTLSLPNDTEGSASKHITLSDTSSLHISTDASNAAVFTLTLGSGVFTIDNKQVHFDPNPAMGFAPFDLDLQDAFTSTSFRHKTVPAGGAAATTTKLSDHLPKALLDSLTAKKKHGQASNILKNAPRLFIVCGDGTGVELLRPIDVLRFALSAEEQSCKVFEAFSDNKCDKNAKNLLYASFVQKNRVPVGPQMKEIAFYKQVAPFPVLSNETYLTIVGAKDAFLSSSETAKVRTSSEAELLNAMQAVDTHSYLPPVPESVELSDQASITESIERAKGMSKPTVLWEKPRALLAPAHQSQIVTPLPTSPGKKARKEALMLKPILEGSNYFESAEGKLYYEKKVSK